MAESKEELKSHLMTKMMSSGSITSWQIDGTTMETVTDFIFFGSKITVDDDYSHEIKRHVILGRKAMTNLVVVLQSVSRVQLFVTPWIAAHQASLSFNISQALLKLIH